MSSQKILKIDPKLFTFSGKKKEKTKKKQPDISDKTNLKTNKVKQELLKKVKNYQKNSEIESNIEKKENNNFFINTAENLFDNNEFEREFNKSLSFLHELSKKNKQKKLKHNTIKTKQSPVNINLSKDLSIDKPKYSNLKNGSMPTFRELNKTQKNIKDKRITIDLDRNQFDTDINKIEKNLNFINPLENSIEDPIKNSIEDPIKNSIEDPIKNSIEDPIKNSIKNSIEDKIEDKIEDPIRNQIQDIRKDENKNNNFNDIIDSKINTIKNLDENNKFDIEKPNICIDNNDITSKTTNENSNENNNENNNEINNQINNNFNINIPKINRITKKYKYKLGKKNNNIGILIKNNKTLKKIKEEIEELKKKSIQEIKDHLREKNLIKLGSNAPNDVLRKLYEDSILAGDVKNNNNNNLVFNYFNS